MDRTQKAAEIESLKEKFAKSRIALLTDYKGLSVEQLTKLRQKLKESDSSFKVVKNRLAKIAIKGTPVEVINDYFVGTTAVALSETDPTGPAKVLTEFAKENELLKLKAGFLDGKAMSLNDIKYLASLPSREVLIAKLMGSMQAPATNLVNVLSQIPRQVVNVLSAIRDKKENHQ